MVGNMVTTWQERMLDCTALPKGVVAPADTLNMAVIDRHYSAGCSFLNLPDVLTHLQVSCLTLSNRTLTLRMGLLAHNNLHEQALMLSCVTCQCSCALRCTACMGCLLLHPKLWPDVFGGGSLLLLASKQVSLSSASYRC